MASGRGEYVDLKMCAERVLDEWIPLYVYMYIHTYVYMDHKHTSTYVHTYVETSKGNMER